MKYEQARHEQTHDGPRLPTDEERREYLRLEGQLDALESDIERARRDLVRATSAHFDAFLAPGPESPHRPTPAPTGERVELRDGSAVLIRPVAPGDTALVEEGFENLGAVNRYRQFLFGRPDARAVTAVDRDHLALGAVDPRTGAGVGLARYVRDASDPTRAIVAVLVVDSWQGRGLATRLLQRLTEDARANGIDRFEAHMIVGDTSSERMFESVGALERTTRANGVVDVTVRIG